MLVDSLADLRMAAADETRFREFAYSLVQRFSRLGVSIMMTFEVQDLFEAPRLSDSAVSHLSDNIVLLSYVKSRTRSIESCQSSNPAQATTSPASVSS